MKSRKVSNDEKKRVLSYCEFVVLFIAAIFINIKLAVAILAMSPVIIPVLVGIKDRNFHFLNEDKCTTKDIATT